MSEKQFEKYTAKKRIRSMLRVDVRRMLISPLLYIALAICLVMPVIILVMTTMMDGTVTVDPQTGVETVIEGFDNVWQMIGTVSGTPSADAAPAMGLTSMVNINMLYFGIAAVVCIFVSEDFRSGYSKNLFTVRANKGEYVLSKTVVLTAVGALMLLAFFVGTMLGGVIAGLPFEMVGFGAFNILMCLLSKLLLVGVFVPIYLVMSVIAKDKLWLSLILSFSLGMLLFMMIPMITPLNATALHPILCIGGALMFGFGLGAVSRAILAKTSLV